MAEATTLLMGIKIAVAKGIRHLIIEGDNLLIVKLVQGKCECPWYLDYLIEDVRSALQLIDHWEIHLMYREANQAAVSVAFVGHLVT